MNTDTLPSKVLSGVTFFPVPEFDGPTVVFGAPESVYLPRRELPKVPRQFDNMAHDLFYQGGKLPELSPQVDRLKARRALQAWLGSFQPSHESKMTAVAYALWVWTTLDQQTPDPSAASAPE